VSLCVSLCDCVCDCVCVSVCDCVCVCDFVCEWVSESKQPDELEIPPGSECTWKIPSPMKVFITLSIHELYV